METFMDMALYHPEYGYYMTRDPFGIDGDFTTSPEISQMFGELIGAWIIDTWIKMGSPERFQLIECGAGRGTMMADIWRVCKAVDSIAKAVQIRIIETSPLLKKIQKTALEDAPVTWIDTLDELDNTPIIVLGNEFLDAMPVRQFFWTKEGWKERGVSLGIDDSSGIDSLCAEDTATDIVPDDVRENKLVMNQAYEYSPAQKRVIGDISCALKKNTGACLLIDYGYTSGQGDTLQAVKGHEHTEILHNIGECDLTAHVNFSLIRKWAKQHNLTIHGPQTQGVFLLSLGIESRANILSAAALKIPDKTKSQNAIDHINSAKERLIQPKKMGSLFKVMSLSYGIDAPLAGF